MKTETKKQDGRKNNGGARPGAGAKPTGRVYVHIGFSVHPDDVDVIKELVREKKKELSDKRGGAPPVKIRDLNEPTNQVKPITDPPTKSNKAINTYLEKRRQAKSGS